MECCFQEAQPKEDKSHRKRVVVFNVEIKYMEFTIRSVEMEDIPIISALYQNSVLHAEKKFIIKRNL